jgi:hypothetical protein
MKYAGLTTFGTEQSEGIPTVTFHFRSVNVQGHPEQLLSSMQRFLELLLNEYHVDRKLVDHAAATMAAGKPDADLTAMWISDFLRSSLRSPNQKAHRRTPP